MKSGNGNGPYISEGFLAFIVVLIALGIRLLHVLFTAGNNPLAANLTLDAAIYDRWAKTLVWGGAPVPTLLMQAPLYPWIITVIYHLSGPSLTAVRLVQAVMGAASCAFIVVITRRLFRSSTAGIIAGAAAALYLPFIFYEGVLVPATVILFLNLLTVILLAPERRNPGIARILVAGIALGLSVVAKPVAILLVPFAVLHLYFVSREGSGGDAVQGSNARESDVQGSGEQEPTAAKGDGDAQERNERGDAVQGSNARESDLQRGAVREGDVQGSNAARGRSRAALFMKRSALLVAGVILALIPLTLRNYRITGRFTPFTTGGGINFYIGNNPRANGFYTVPFYRGKPIGGTPEEQLQHMHAFAAAEAGRELSPNEVSSFWLRRGIEYITTHPGEWGALTWRKFLFFWNRYERANVENMDFHRRFGGIIGLPLLTFGIVAPFGLLGIFMERNRWRNLWLLYGGITVYLAAALIFYVLSRYRLPVVPFLVPFAGAAVTGLLKYLRDRRWSEIALLAVALIVLFYFTNMTVATDTPAGTAGNLKRLGSVYLARGDTTMAMETFREAARTDPSDTAPRQIIEQLERMHKETK